MSAEKHYLYKELAQKLGKDESLFDWFELSTTDGLWYWDLNHPEHEWLSPQFKRIFGYTNDEIPNTSEWWQANIFKEDLPKVLDNFEKHKADPSFPYDQTVRYRHKDGSTVWVRCRGLIIRDEAGNPSRMLGTHTNLTQLMQTKEMLEDARRDLKSRLADITEINKVVLQTAGIGIWLWDLQTNQIVWDDTLQTLYELDTSNEPLDYQQWRNAIHMEDIDFLETKIQNAINDKKIFRADIRVPLKSGKVRYVKVAAEIFYDDEGIPLRMRGANWDISEEKLREQELQRSNHDLEQFAYVASHDLRAPLSGIRQLATWLEEDLQSPSASVKHHLGMMHKRINRMENMLSDILTYSRVDKTSNSESVSLEECSLSDLVNEIYANAAAPEAMNLQLQTDGCGETMIILEATKFTRVLQNLITNAIKHRTNDKSTILVYLTRDRHNLYCEVADNNNPIQVAYQEKIFNMFQTLKPRDEIEGSGMGLPIARRLVESLGGRLWYSSVSVKPSEAMASSLEHPDIYQNYFCFTWPHKQ